jgi:hypothetical protein
MNTANSRGPFDEFLNKATRLFAETPVTRDVKDLKEYASITEDRRFYFDVLDRVEMLAYVFARLKELALLYLSADENIARSMQAVEGTLGTFDVPGELLGRQDRVVLEARCLTSYLYYELAGLANMLEKRGISFVGELAYMVKARNFFIAHPQPRSALRNSRSSLEITQGGLLHTHAINAAETDPQMMEHYLGRPIDARVFDQISEALQKNRELLVEGRESGTLSYDEAARLKVFGVPEPDLDIVQAELAEAISARLLPKIVRAAKRPLPVGR